MSELRDAIEAVYRVFAHWRRGPKLNFYPGWEPPAADVTALLFMPLSQIDATTLTRYAYAATAYGRPEDDWWPFYLPRIVENVANYDFPADGAKDASFEYSFFLLHSWNDIAPGPPAWRSAFAPVEVRALDDFVSAFWSAHVGRPYHCITPDPSSICGKASGGKTTFHLIDLFIGAGFPAGLITAAIDASSGALADIYLADVVTALTDSLDGSVALSPWANGPHVAVAKDHFAEWLSQPHLGQRLDLAGKGSPRPREQILIDQAIERLITTGGYTG
jgi:hypothetical protein